MQVAFVGIKRPFATILDEIGIDHRTFVRFHLEMPFYFAKYGRNNVQVTTVDTAHLTLFGESDWAVHLIKEDELEALDNQVVVHWRSWQEWAFHRCPDAVHLIQTCDHTYTEQWKTTVRDALAHGKLCKIIAFETWHVRQLQQELGVGFENFITQVHLGVDTDVYFPEEKDPHQLLWASDPGRGLGGCLLVFEELYKRDRRYRLHITFPDYVEDLSVSPSFSHPGIRLHRKLRNGPELWGLFNTSAIIPYTSCFMEPSSRVHRQGQAAGCLVVYPSDSGSPSELIMNGRTGLVIPKALNAYGWARMIEKVDAQSIGRQARIFALTEDWEVQAVRFNRVMRELLER